MKGRKRQFKCHKCGCRFVLKNTSWIESAYLDYTIHKQTYSELEKRYGKSEKTLRKYFDKLNQIDTDLGCFNYFKFHPTINDFTDREISLIFDTTFFKRTFGTMVFRTKSGVNLCWNFVQSETIIEYEYCLDKLTHKAIKFKSFTIDGRRGVIQMLQRKYPKTPVQICHFHQIKTVITYTTKNPQTTCGQELRQLILTLSKTTETEFTNQFNNLQQKYKEFLKERNENNQFQHKRLRSAFRSIKANLPYLFTHLEYKELNIPNTSNSCDGSFGHWKGKVKIHRGLSTQRKKGVIDAFLSH